MTKTVKEIYKQSIKLYRNIRTIGKNGQTSKWAYYYCKCILNNKKDVKTVKQADATKTTGKSINTRLTKSEYLKLMEKYCKWVETNKKLPNYVTIKETKIKPKIWNAYVGYLFKVYYETGKLPANQTIKSDIYINKNKKYGHSTTAGCDNMGQNNGYYCGCHSLQEVFRNLYNIVVPQSTIASWCGTTEDGTSHDGLNTGVAIFNQKYNKNLKVSWKNFSDLGWNGIKKIIESNNQDCIIHNLYRNQWGHYEVVNNVSSNINVQNSLGDKCDAGCYSGYIEYRTQSEYYSYISGISQKSIMILTKG